MNCLIYPYYDKLYAVIDNLRYFNPDLNIKAAVYPRAWKKTIKNTEKLNDVILSNDISEYINEVECLIISDVSDKEYMYEDILRKIEMALAAEKKVIVCTRIDDEDIESIKIKYPDSDIKYLYDDAEKFPYRILKYKPLNCAVVGVGPLYRGLDDTVAVTYLAGEFRKKGYNTAVVTTNESCRLLGFYPFPFDIFKNSEDIEYKVEQLNAYFSELEEKTNCDVMIIQFPDGMAKYSEYTSDSFGIKAYMLSCAASIDYFVLVSSCEVCEAEQYNVINSALIKNFGYGMDAVVIQPIRLSYDFNPEFREYSFTHNRVDEYKLKTDELRKSTKTFFEIDDTSCYSVIAEQCIDKLS